MGNKKKIKVIVTGGAGFIGSHLVAELLKQKFDVHVVDNLSGGRREHVPYGAKLHVCDIKNINALLPIFKNARYVFHLAALPRVQYSLKYPVRTNNVNVGGTLNVLIAAQKSGVQRVIYSASSSAYGDQKKLPLVESMDALPKSPYGLQKYIGELYCRLWSDLYALETVSLRYFNVYGPGQSSKGAYALVIAKFFKQRAEGKPMTITGTGAQTRDFTNIKDIVRANLLAMKSKKVGKGEVINIGCGNNQSIKHIADLLGGPITFVPTRLEPKDTLADNSLAKKLLGWVPQVTIKQGIEELKNHPCPCGSGKKYKKCHGK